MTLEEVQALAACHPIRMRVTDTGVEFASLQEFMILVNAIEQRARDHGDPDLSGSPDSPA